MPSSVGAPAPQITVESHKKDWTIVRWCHKVADSVSGKFEEGSTIGKWFGRAVAVVFVPFGIIPALVGDSIHGIKSLFERRVETNEAIDKKIPAKAEFEALKAENEALKADNEALKAGNEALIGHNNEVLHGRTLAAEADVRKAKRANDQLKDLAERQVISVFENLEKEKAALKEEAELEKIALVKQTEEAHRIACKSKDSVIHMLQDKLKAQDEKLAVELERFRAQEQKIESLTKKIEEIDLEVINRGEDVSKLMMERNLFEAAAIEEANKNAFLLSMLAPGKKNPWQDEHQYEPLEKDVGVCSETGSVSGFTTGSEVGVTTMLTNTGVPGAEEGVVSLPQGRVPAFMDRMDQLNEGRATLYFPEEVCRALQVLSMLIGPLPNFGWAGEGSESDSQSALALSSISEVDDSLSGHIDVNLHGEESDGDEVFDTHL